MKQGKLIKQAWMTADETLRVMGALQEDGGEARFVGGCVRDALSNRKVIDIDIATPLKPDEVIERLKRNKINYAPTGLKHGTVTAVADGKPFEITTLRLDVNTFGRHADVVFTNDWQADASRRDFTINAMYATLEGEVYDPFGGIADLRSGRVVFVGDPEKRIAEDVLRILRFFRFFAHFGKGEPDAAALEACCANAGLLSRLSSERVRQETLKLMDADTAAEVWQIMLKKRVVTHFLPEATNTKSLARLIRLEEKFEAPGFALRRLAALLDVTKTGFKHVADSLRLSNAQTQQLERMSHGDDEIHPHMEHAEARRLVYRYGNDMARSLLLLHAARSGDETDLANLYSWATTFRPPRFPLTGEDVMKIGWKSGPDVGFVLGAVESWWMAEDFMPGRTQCLAKLKADYMPKGK